MVQSTQMRLFNKTFYRFLFGFVAIIAGSLLLIILAGTFL